MAKAKLFSEQNKIGSEIALYLSGGQVLSGRIESISADYVVLVSGDDKHTLFFEMISGWKPVVCSPTATHTEISGNRDEHGQEEQQKSSDDKLQNFFDPLVFDVFRAAPTIPVPEPNFKIENLGTDDSQELVRAKNKYEYANKIKELSRLNNIIPPLVRLAERTRYPSLFLLCGTLQLRLSINDDARLYLNESLIEPTPEAFSALASIEASHGNWVECGQYLKAAIKLSDQRGISTSKFLNPLGATLGQCQDKELKGLSDVFYRVADDQKQLALLILAFALYERYPAAASLVMVGKIQEAQEIAGNSPVFSAVELPRKEKPVGRTLIAPLTSASENVMQFGYISAVYARGRKFFGFIRDEVRNETFYFNSDHVIDANLRDEIKMDKAGQKVDFIPAKSITPDTKSKSITPDTKYRMAMEVKRSGIDIAPIHVERRKVITTPSRTAPAYERARIAESQNNMEEAAKNYKEEIRNKGPYWQSAVMDLSSLLHRQGKTEEAIELLDQYASKLDKKDAVPNQKITFLMAAKQYMRAADIIKRFINDRHPDRNRKNTLFRQLSYCQYKAGKYDDAIVTLTKLPQDSAIREFIQRVEQAKKSPIAHESAAMLFIDRELYQWTSGISPFARYLLDNFDDSYIDERTKARGYFDKKDFYQLRTIYDKMSGKRPGEKGKVLLTLAALCEKVPDAAGDSSVADFLRPALSLMGEAAIYEGIHNDIARCYLTEAASIGSERDISVTLALLLSTYLMDSPVLGHINTKKEKADFLSDSINRLTADSIGQQRFKRDFIYYSTMSAAITGILQKLLGDKDDRQLTSLVKDKQKLQQERDSEMERLRCERNNLSALCERDYPAAGAFIEAASQLRDTAETTRFETDRYRLNLLGSIARDVAVYLNESDYVERERKFLRLSQEILNITEEIKKKPTKLSIELMLPFLEKMDKKLKSSYKHFVETSTVQLVLSNVLENDYYIPESNGNVRVCISVKSVQGGAPIEGLEISAEESHGLSVIKSGLSPELFRGSEEREVELTIKPSPEQIADAAFTLQCIVRYRKRNGELVKLSKQALPVRIGSPKDFSLIVNPYKDYAGGLSIDNPDMFIGRQELLRRIIDVVNANSSGQCFVLYGQKRSGKTSVLKQLKKRLKCPLLAAEISVGALETTSDDTGNNFFQLCLDRIQEAAEDTAGLTNLSWWPQPLDIQTRPLEAFRKAIKGLKKELEDCGWHLPRLVLLIDEFTYLYEYIAEDVLPPTFMRQWKSLLQMELFNAVIVGQDSMPKFKQAYPNEFGVTFDERITYLSLDEAIQLAQDPILLNGQSRYRGRALDRLLQLTAGSPFYMQIFCDRLVRHMNRKQAPFITEADIELVASLLTTGADALPIERFDPLITAAGESVAEAAREKYLALLMSIARNSDAITGARPTELPAIEKKEAMLRDMQERDVTVSDAEGRVKIRVELFQEWLKVHSDFMDLEVQV